MSSRPTVAGVVFDLDGTLGETLPVCFAAFRTVFERDHGVAYSDSEIRAMFGPSERGVFQQRAKGDADELLADYLVEYADQHHLAEKPFEGIVALLDVIKTSGVPMAVVTGKGPASAELTLRHWGIHDWFTHVLAGSDGGDVKVLNMQTVVDAWGLPGESIVAIGDITADVERAHRIGLRAVSAAWSTHADLAGLLASGAEQVFTAVTDFAAWLTPQLAVSNHGSHTRPLGQKVK